MSSKFRGVGKSDGEFDNGQGELADAAAALDWLERENFDNSQCWVSGFSFGSLIAMQLLMRRPEINRLGKLYHPNPMFMISLFYHHVPHLV